MAAKQTERERQRLKQAATRASERDLQLRPPKNIKQRRACIKDPFLFMKTYFGWIFTQPFIPSRVAMVNCIIHAARYGGDFAVAAGRGSGKSAIALFTALWLDIRGDTVLPLIIGKNQSGAEEELTNLKQAIVESPKFADDFPEICLPIIALEDWASAARKQTVLGGHRTKIGWQKDCIFLPTIPDKLVRKIKGWPPREPSYARGQGFAVVGIDGKIRGFKRRNTRPRLAIFDDIDDRESATSIAQTADNRIAIDQDSIGLAGSGSRTSRAMLCTTINDHCIAALYTSLPGWRGQRFKAITKMPDREDLLDEYIRLREERDKNTDPDARSAHAFYLKNKKDIERGGVVDNPYDFVSKLDVDGEPLEVSALQHYFNLIADVKWNAFLCEWQNDPPESDSTIYSGLTRELVRSRLSGFNRREVPPDAPCITIGCDLGKKECHWVAGAFSSGGACRIIHHDKFYVGETGATAQEDVVERAIFAALMNWRDALLADPFTDANGNAIQPVRVLIDCGYLQRPVTEFCRQFGEPFRPCKGNVPYKSAPSSHDRKQGQNFHAGRQPDRSWLWFQDADYWKRAVHDRFLTEPIDDDGRYRNGALTLFVPKAKDEHYRYAEHIVAEEWITEFTEGKGEKSHWYKKSVNNHWLDATALMLCAAEMADFGLFAAPKRSVVMKTPAEWIAASKGQA